VLLPLPVLLLLVLLLLLLVLLVLEQDAFGRGCPHRFEDHSQHKAPPREC
jgi:hypothetical protein